MFSIHRIPLALASLLLISPAALIAQRLPGAALPQHYTLQLTPNLQAATFTGHETIDLTLKQAADSIVLNAWELKFDTVAAQIDGKTLPAQVSLDPGLQQATFHFAQTLPPGRSP